MNGKTAELKKACEEAFKDMRQFDAEHRDKSWGFHFTYSPEKSWRDDTKVLLLTINPQSWDMETNSNKLFIPNSIWPDNNDFFAPPDFKIRKPILTLLREIAIHKKIMGVKGAEQLEKNIILNSFVDENVVIASFVPFRTPSSTSRYLPNSMKQFSEEKYWNKILQIWRPNLIITIGGIPFDGIQNIFEKTLNQRPEPEEKPGSDYPLENTKTICSGVYKSCDYAFPPSAEHPAGNTVHLVGLPHPSKKFGWMGFPTKTLKDSAPVLQYIREKLAEMNF